MAKKTENVVRNPIAMLLAGVIMLVGLAIVLLGVTNIGAFGWWSIPLIASGLSSMGFASATIVTGKPEWILLDLLLPG